MCLSDVPQDFWRLLSNSRKFSVLGFHSFEVPVSAIPQTIYCCTRILNIFPATQARISPQYAELYAGQRAEFPRCRDIISSLLASSPVPFTHRRSQSMPCSILLKRDEDGN